MEDPHSEQAIVESWHTNAVPWSQAVRQGKIETRRLCTDEAIIRAVLDRDPQSVVDLGCGEGWLARALSAQGIDVLGVDAVPELIERARAAGGGEFQVVSYETLGEGGPKARADIVVCNFSLFGHFSVERVFRAVPALLKPGGAFIVQTLHPVSACGDSPYGDGWRKGSWAGFGPEFKAPGPWYFRTLGSWIRLFLDHGYLLEEVREPVHPGSGKPASVLFVGRRPPGSRDEEAG
jgi:2-polyprenyl-3-methyl-5-hydroxy-6-metoxy-1,4-benzoquinol methylase